MNKDQLRNLIRNLILEVKKEKTEKEEAPYLDKKDGTTNYLNGEKSKYKKNVDNKPGHTAHALLAKIEKAVKKIDSIISVELDDHNDITVIFPGVFRIRVRPNWSNNYNVEAFRNMSDRVYAVGLDDKQVLNFIKVNFATQKKSYQQKAYDKSMDNLKDKTEKKAAELPKTEPVDPIEVPEKEKEELDHPQDDPMSVAEEPKRQEDHDVEKNKAMKDAMKMAKKDVDDSLTVKQKDQTTSKMGKKV